jgi:trehalose 6-phosphate synthase
MRRARIGLVTPLRDGMNLVAKEYVAAQNPADPGILVLSRFAGAAQELHGAVTVNPHDPDEIANAINHALTMDPEERKRRWETDNAAFTARAPGAWADGFLRRLREITEVDLKLRAGMRRYRADTGRLSAGAKVHRPAAKQAGAVAV